MDNMKDSRSARRTFLTQASTMGAAAVLGLHTSRAAAEPPSEIKHIRLVDAPTLCLAPQYLAEELLRLEGFSDIEYVKLPSGAGPQTIASGHADLTMWDTPSLLPVMDSAQSLLVVGGVHSGCSELFGNERVKGIRDLRGKTVAVSAFGGTEHVFVSSTAAYVGLDPRKDIQWIEVGSIPDAMRMFIEGKSDAFMGFPPQPQELRARKVGHVLVNTLRDRPWSQYFCCSIVVNRSFVQRNPVATKRAIRAILKAAEICADDPERAVRYMVSKGYETRPDIAREVLSNLPYRRWREANPEDTLRFHALRLHEAGMIKSDPQKLIAQGTDWRFLNELKKELKA